ncbi:MAG: polysaccharide biosynthesis tyrosine autokinase [Myxococcales bacterium FL481]|nr:MAG: polysaccharide biosynthesis tyrosine autokinase [Myxococcales bacterium FL481]
MAVPGDPVSSPDATTGAEASATRPLDLATEHLLGQAQARNPLRDLVRLARRRLKTIAAIWLLTVLGAGTYAVFAVPVYTASGVVQVSSKDALGAGNPLLQFAGRSGKLEVQTEVEIMRQREFLLAVLLELRLNIIDPNQAKFVTPNLDVTLGQATPVDPKLRAIRAAVSEASLAKDRFREVRLRLTATDTGTLQIEPWNDGKYGEATELELGRRYESARARLAFSSLPMSAGESAEIVLVPDGRLLQSYLDRLHIAQLGSARSPTNLVRVELTGHDRHTAAAVVQAIMRKYLQQDLEWQALRASRSAEFVREQLDKVNAGLREHEEALQRFAETEQAVDLSAQAKVTIENAAALETERAQVELQERLVGAVARRLRDRLSTGEAAHLTANFFDDELLGAAIASLTENEIRHETLRATLTDEHPNVRELGAQIARQRREVAKLLRTTQRNLASRAREIDRALSEISDSLSRYPDKQLQLARLTRSVEVSQRLYSFLLEKLQESEIMKAATTTDKRIVDAAAVPHIPSKPRRGRIVLLGIVGGVALGLGLVYAARLLRQRLDTVEAVRDIAPYPVHATIPKIETEDGEGGDGRVQLAQVWQSPHDPAPEAFRTLRVNVSFVPARGSRGRILQVTSSQPGEGKSTVLSNLAMSLTRSGSRVIILDLDLRRPMQHRIWRVARAPGFSEFIAKGETSPDSIHLRSLENCGADLLPSGGKTPETLASVMSAHFPAVLRKLADRYDYVLVDSPPVFVADTMVVAQYVDLVLVTARPGHVTRTNLSHAIDFLGRLPHTRKGLVLNGVGSEHTEYYYGKNYYYYGRSYSGSDSDQPRAA